MPCGLAPTSFTEEIINYLFFNKNTIMNEQQISKKVLALTELINRDKAHEEEFLEKYQNDLDKVMSELSDSEKLHLVTNYEDTLQEYMVLYLTLCIGLEKDENRKIELTEHRDKALTTFLEFENDTMFKNAEKILDRELQENNIDAIGKAIILQKLKLFWGPLGQLKITELSATEFHEKSSECNETIERTEGRDIAKYSIFESIGAQLVALASVQHEAKNTKVTLWRRILDNFLKERDVLQENLPEKIVNEKELKLVIETLKNQLTDQKNEKENPQNQLLRAFYQLEDSKGERRNLIKTGKVLASSLTVVGVGFFIAGIVSIPISFGLGTTIPLAAGGVGSSLIGAVIQRRIGTKLLPETDFKAEAFGEVLKGYTSSLKENLKQPLQLTSSPSTALTEEQTEVHLAANLTRSTSLNTNNSFTTAMNASTDLTPRGISEKGDVIIPIQTSSNETEQDSSKAKTSRSSTLKM